MLKQFKITRLFGERDVQINFDSNIRILVAENGYGKTTILNALYYVLSGQGRKLRKINFQSIELSFMDGDKFEFTPTDLAFSDSYKKSGIYEHFLSILGDSLLEELIEVYLFGSKTEFKNHPAYKTASRRFGLGDGLPSYFGQLFTNKDPSSYLKSNKKFQKIKSKFKSRILYLPTYRRVEIDFGITSDQEEIKNDGNINFGMRDVDELIKTVSQEILTSSVEWFSKVNGQMLSQLVQGFALDDQTKESIKNPEAIKIVLDRIGNNIDSATKQQIIKLIETDKIFIDHDPLIYFISNLTKVYEQQKENDRAIQSFTEVCNKYLGDKMIKYDESTVSVEVVRRKNGTPVLMEMLSSGEKQIISLFAKLYLNKQNDVAIFFDEPELSLSMEWQKNLLPDIINSGKCSFLFSTTHSPFIFDNDLISHTVDLAEYIREL